MTLKIELELTDIRGRIKELRATANYIKDPVLKDSILIISNDLEKSADTIQSELEGAECPRTDTI